MLDAIGSGLVMRIMFLVNLMQFGLSKSFLWEKLSSPKSTMAICCPFYLLLSGLEEKRRRRRVGREGRSNTDEQTHESL